MYYKCDETKPICRQCIKSRRHCSGYRSDFDILHRDETQATENRAKRAAAKKAARRAAEGGGGGGGGGAFIQFEAVPKQSAKKQASPAAGDAGVSPSTSSSVSPSTTALAISSAHTSPLEVSFPVTAPSLPIDQHASHYFAAHFIMLPGERGFRAGHLDYLLPLLRSETNSHSAFQLAYAACGLAAMSNRKRAVNTDLSHIAALQHARACEAVAKAIGDPVLRKSDATLAAVLLLIFFEVREDVRGVVGKREKVGVHERVLICIWAENYGIQRSGLGHMAVTYRRRHGDCEEPGRGDAAKQVLGEAVQRCATPHRT